MSQMTDEIPPTIRHWCTQHDGLPMYGWFVHDGKTFGHQVTFVHLSLRTIIDLFCKMTPFISVDISDTFYISLDNCIFQGKSISNFESAV